MSDARRPRDSPFDTDNNECFPSQFDVLSRIEECHFVRGSYTSQLGVPYVVYSLCNVNTYVTMNAAM